jgi:hypothetical protein
MRDIRQQQHGLWGARQRSARIVAALLVLLLLATFFPGAAGVQPPRAQAQNQSLVYFPQTGHFLGGLFRTFWEQRGGLALFGYPITPEYVRASDGKVVQYFERARFELGSTGNQPIVELGMIGRDLAARQGRSFERVPPIPDTPTRRFFPETGHTLQGAFKNFWEGNGGVIIFGYPISEEFTDTVADGSQRIVQYFERARFELIGNTVNLTLIGRALAPCQLLPPRPQDLPPSGPLPEGDDEDCDEPEKIVPGRAYPEVASPGTIMGFEALGFQPGEQVSLWLNRPDQSVRSLPYRAVADENGYVLIGFQTEPDDVSGPWSLVGQGVESGRTSVAPFRLQP